MPADAVKKRPNFVVLVADDLGYGDLSIYGNDTMDTRNIDSIGLNGVKLTHALATASVCTPSRAALLTGRYPVRYGMASSYLNRVFLFIAQRGGLPDTEKTFASYLKDNHYETALLGKWHLGNDGEVAGDRKHHPNQHGFNYFYGTPLTNLKDFNGKESVVVSNFPRFYLFIITNGLLGLVSVWQCRKFTWYKCSYFLLLITIITSPLLLLFQQSITLLNSVLMENGQVTEQPIRMENLTQRLTSKAQQFISHSVTHDKSFLLMVNFLKVHSSHFPSTKFQGKSLHGPFGDCLLELDASVGQILQTLRQFNVLENTVVIFTSDNGGHLEDTDWLGRRSGGSNGPLRGGKGQGAMEGAIRIPLLIQWSDFIQPTQVNTHFVSLMDIAATILHAANIKPPENVDGKSLLPLLSGPLHSPHHHHHDVLFHYCGTSIHGATLASNSTNDVFKVYFYTPRFIDTVNFKCFYVCQCTDSIHHDPPLVYNIARDISEKYPLASDSGTYINILETLTQKMSAHLASVDTTVESQFSLVNSLWRPNLQPCCSSLANACYC